MPRKQTPKTPVKTGDQVSPAVGDKPVAKTAAPRAAKVVRKKPAVSNTSKAAKAPTKSKPAAKKPAAARAPRSTEKEGTTKIENPIALSDDELEALRIADSHGLDRRQQRFIDLWVVSQNAGQSYRDAGYKCKNDNVAAVGASKLLKKVKNHPYTKWRQAELFKRTADIQNEVIEQIRSAALADVRELVEYKRRCCRYCYGIDHLYQFKKHEWVERVAEHEINVAIAKGANQAPPLLEEQGGIGFNHTLPPVEKCTNCYGEGVGRSVFKDTANLSPGAVVLYEGVKEGKDGTEMRVGKKKDYLQMLASVFDLKVEPEIVVQTGVTKEQLEEILAKAEAQTMGDVDAMQERERRLAEGDKQ